MTLLDRIKALVGLGSKGSESSDRDVEVTVEDSTPDQSPDGGSGAGAQEHEDPEDWGVPPGYDGDESEVQAGPEAFSDVQGSSGVESDDSQSSTAESAGEATAGSTTATDRSEGESDWRPIDDAEESTASPIEEAEPESTASGPELTEIKGIGPAYEDRLIDAGVATVPELIDAETSGLAADTDLSETRIGRWQERAEALRE